MSRPKDQFIHATGGFRIGESTSQFQNRATEIAKLEKRWKSGKLPADEASEVLRRIRELKGINIEFDDE